MIIRSNHHRRTIPSLVLLDRDGVINEDVGTPGVLESSQLVLTPGAGTAIARLKQAGCWIAIITNQSCVGKGLISLQQLNDIHYKLQELLLEEHPQARIDKIYQCTSTNKKGGDDMDMDPRQKPRPGMILEAMTDFGRSSTTTTITTTGTHCCFVGDTATDLEAAAAANVPERWLVSTGYGEQLMGIPPPPCDEPVWIESSVPGIVPSAVPFWYCRNLAQAVESILASEEYR